MCYVIRWSETKHEACQRNRKPRRCSEVDSKQWQGCAFHSNCPTIYSDCTWAAGRWFLSEFEGFLLGRLPPTAVIISTSVCVQGDNCLFFNLPMEFQGGVLEATNVAVKVVYNSIKVSALLSLLFPVVKEPCHYSIRGKMKSRLKWGNACCHSVQCLLSSSLISKNVKIKILKTIILPVDLCDCESW